MNRFMRSQGVILLALSLGLWPFVRPGLSSAAPAQEQEDLQLVEEKEVQKATAALALAKDVKSRVALLAKRANMLEKLKRYEESEADCTSLIGLEPNNPLWIKKRGDVRVLRKLNQGAVDDYTAYLVKVPGDGQATKSRGRAYGRLGQYDRAIQDYDQALKLQPQDNDLLVLRGWAKLRLGNAQAAVQDFTAAIAADPRSVYAHEGRSDANAELRKMGPAIEDSATCIALAPEDPYYHKLRGIRYWEAGQYERSLSDLNKALELDPGYADAFGSRGDTYLSMGEYQKAVADYTKFLESNPKMALAYQRRGQSYDQLKRFHEALADYRKAVELNPRSIGNLNSLAWMLATCPLAAVRNGPQAVEYAQKALELAGGDDYQYMDTLAAAYAEMGRFDEATALQEKALSRLPSDAGTEERADLEQRLDLYKKRKPFHEK